MPRTTRPRANRRAQDDPPGLAKSRPSRTVLARGQGRGQRQPPERLPDLRDRRGRRHALHRDGAARGRVRWRSASSAGRSRSPRRGHRAGMLAALSALHAREIVHRDVKPSNVFLTPHGVKLLDFGLARATKPQAAPRPDASQVTQAGFIVGTPRYMAPEQIRERPLDASRRPFAVGSILFEMLTGWYRFCAEGPSKLLYAVAHEQRRRSPDHPPSSAVDRVVASRARQAPAERYENAAAMARDLREALASRIPADGAAPVRTLTR